jgi:hypothetical protein
MEFVFQFGKLALLHAEDVNTLAAFLSLAQCDLGKPRQKHIQINKFLKDGRCNQIHM